MERYDHGKKTPSESFKTFTVADRCIAEHGVGYDEYKQVAEKVKSLGHGIDWLVPKGTFDFLVEESTRRILER
ncbi:MAG: hypothetical protein ACUVYA_09065 [Planctomycetota bacterium]